MSGRRGRWIVLAIGVALASIFFIDVCGWLYGCGCRSLWAGAAEACNIHHDAPPHCPWCVHPLAGGGIAYIAAIAVQAAVAYAPLRIAVPARLGLAVLAIPVTLGVVALVHGTWWEYWG